MIAVILSFWRTVIIYSSDRIDHIIICHRTCFVRRFWHWYSGCCAVCYRIIGSTCGSSDHLCVRRYWGIFDDWSAPLSILYYLVGVKILQKPRRRWIQDRTTDGCCNHPLLSGPWDWPHAGGMDRLTLYTTNLVESSLFAPRMIPDTIKRLWVLHDTE